MNRRTLKIEAHGDYWRGVVKPKIRLSGHWLELAGFKPGSRVSVHCIEDGVIELRCHNTLDNGSVKSVKNTPGHK